MCPGGGGGGAQDAPGGALNISQTDCRRRKPRGGSARPQETYNTGSWEGVLQNGRISVRKVDLEWGRGATDRVMLGAAGPPTLPPLAGRERAE